MNTQLRKAKDFNPRTPAYADFDVKEEGSLEEFFSCTMC